MQEKCNIAIIASVHASSFLMPVKTRRCGFQAFTKPLVNEHLTCMEWPQDGGLLERELIVASDCGAGTKLLTPEQQQETTYCDGSLEVHPKLIRSALSH